MLHQTTMLTNLVLNKTFYSTVSYRFKEKLAKKLADDIQNNPEKELDTPELESIQRLKKESITPFIDLDWKDGAPVKYKDSFSIGEDGVPVCRA